MEIFLLALVITEAIVIVIIYAQLKYYKTLEKNTSVMGVLQKILETMGASKTSEQKLEDVNQMLIEHFGCKFSTIAWYNGSGYDIKSTNVPATYIDMLKEVVNGQEFKENLAKNVSKYITTTGSKNLSYNTAIEREVKSAMLSPIYDADTFIGYWLLEDIYGGAFDNVPKEHLANIKNNLAIVLENTNSQQIVERLANTDKLTGFKNSMYLYSNLRVMMNEKGKSAIILIALRGFKEVNNSYGRADGDKVLVKVSEIIKEMFNVDSEHIRYSGDEFVVVCLNTEALNIVSNIEKVISKLTLEPVISSNGDKIDIKLAVACTTYKRLNDLDKIMKDLSNGVEESARKGNIELI